MKWNKLLTLSALGLMTISSAFADISSMNEDKKVYITVGADSVSYTTKKFGSRVERIDTQNDMSVLKIDESALPWLSMLMHKEFKRCGGFMLHDNQSQALKQINSIDEQTLARSSFFTTYNISKQNIVRPMIDQLSKENILQTITKLSTYQNRFYKGPNGKQSAAWIKDYWTSLVKNRSDATVEYFNHSSWDQPSVILTIKGKSSETIVLGGHQDSINMYSMGKSQAKAPGADDNASGIATISEIIRTLVNNNYVPNKTLKFMAYAAEEVGLLGSKEIAQSYKQSGANIIGVMQLDMTNFKGSDQYDIVLMSDFTNEDQNKFVGSIIDTYLPGVTWGYDQCGYACSDHASWFTQGYPTSMPFEAQMDNMNGNIHTQNDTLAASHNNTDHAIKFAKMALGYVVELDK